MIENNGHVTMRLAAAVRALKAGIMPVFQAPTADKLIKAIAAAGKEYRAKTHGRSGHGLGAVDGFY